MIEQILIFSHKKIVGNSNNNPNCSKEVQQWAGIINQMAIINKEVWLFSNYTWAPRVIIVFRWNFKHVALRDNLWVLNCLPLTHASKVVYRIVLEWIINSKQRITKTILWLDLNYYSSNVAVFVVYKWIVDGIAN